MFRFYSDDGFTLTEVLIATVIITVASLGISNLTIGIINGNSFSKGLTTATTLARDRLENSKNIGYSDLSDLVGTEDYGDIINYNNYKRVTSVASNSPMANMKTVNVLVYWESDKHFVNLSTFIAE